MLIEPNYIPNLHSKSVATFTLFGRVNVLAASQTAVNEIGVFIPNNVRAAANNL